MRWSKLTTLILKSWHLASSLHGKQMGKKWKTVADFIFLGSKITVDSECSHEIKRQLLLCRKAMNNLDQPMTLFNIVNETEVDIFSAIILHYL